MTAPAAPPRRSRRKRVAFTLLAFVLLAAVLGAAGEFVARWYFLGGFGAAVDSIVSLRAAADPDPEQHIVVDRELGFRLNPARPGINSLGIPGPEIGPKADGVQRLLVVGDSVSFERPGWVKGLRERLGRTHPHVEVINAAIFGYTTYQERLFLERDLLQLKPDVVLVQYCINDNCKFLHHVTADGRMLTTLEARNFLFPEGDGPWTRLSRASYLVYGLRRALYEATDHDEAFPWDNQTYLAWRDSTWPEQEEHFAAMSRAVAGIGGRMCVLAAPHEDQLRPELLAKDRAYTLLPQRRLRDICKRHAIPFLDLHPVLQPKRADELYTDGLHFSQVGHGLVADAAARFLSERKLVR